MIEKVFSDFSFDIVVNLAAQAGDVPITYADTSVLEAEHRASQFCRVGQRVL